MNPRFQAWLDWRELGEFHPERFEGERRQAYESEMADIMRDYDSRPV